MKSRVLVLLIVVAVLAASGLGFASAQENAQLKALTAGAVTLLAEPSADAEVVGDVAAFTEVTIVGTSRDGAWLEVDSSAGTGYAPLDQFIVLNLPALAPQVMVTTRNVDGVAYFGGPNMSAEYLGMLADGAVASVLGTHGEWTYIQTADGKTGWSIASGWSPLPEGAILGQLVTAQSAEVGIFAEASMAASLVTTVPDGEVVYLIAAVDDNWDEVMTSDGTEGYVTSNLVDPLPTTYVETEVSPAQAGIFDAPNFDAELLTNLPDGVQVVLVSQVDDYWLEVYHPLFGMAYGLQDHFSGAYYPATVLTQDAVVRAGPSSFIYNGVAQLDSGTVVLVTGVNEDGTWVRVSLPFSEVDFGENGVNGWMATFLFQDLVGDQTLDLDVLPVVE